MDFNLSKNPKEKKDEQLAEDEDLDDALKKSSSVNNDVCLKGHWGQTVFLYCRENRDIPDSETPPIKTSHLRLTDKYVLLVFS